MANVFEITSLTNPRIKQVVRLREHRHRRKTGLFVAEGWREVSRAVQAGLTVEQVLFCPERLAENVDQQAAVQRLLDSLPSSVERLQVTLPVLRKVAYVREPEGLLAVVQQPRWRIEDLPPVTDKALYLVAVGSEKPGNLGAMVRTADAAGCTAVLAAGTPVDPFNPNTIRTSTCAVYTIPVVAADEQTVLDYLTQHHIRLIATTPAGAVPHTQADLTGPIAIVIGPEDTGLSDAWLSAADRTGGQRVIIPMRSRVVDSLNASNAAAVLLFEALRQRET